MPNAESLFCLRASEIKALPGGFVRCDSDRIASILHGRGCYVPRDEAERDDSYKQIVVYCIIMVLRRLVSGAPQTSGYLAYRRPAPRDDAENRLSGRLSIGVGGHVNAQDMGGMPGMLGVYAALRREVSEEIRFGPPGQGTWPPPRWAGYINDDSDEVGRHHLGLVALAMAGADVAPNHSDWPWFGVTDYKFIQDHFDEFESWSRLLLREFCGYVRADQPGTSSTSGHT